MLNWIPKDFFWLKGLLKWFIDIFLKWMKLHSYSLFSMNSSLFAPLHVAFNHCFVLHFLIFKTYLFGIPEILEKTLFSKHNQIKTCFEHEYKKPVHLFTFDYNLILDRLENCKHFRRFIIWNCLIGNCNVKIGICIIHQFECEWKC